MKKVGTASTKVSKWAIPAGILTLSFVSVIATGAGPGNSKSTVSKVGSTNQAPSVTQSPAPDASPEISINGVNIPTDSPGKREVNIPGGQAQVEVSEGRTSVYAQSSGATSEAANVSEENVDIRIDSRNSSVNSTSRSSSSLNSHSHTSVSSNGNTSVTITR